ncbi:UTRA domain-containing protein [Thalassotalea sp. ND16A]|uniref:UTRA domain-containing protein n=1 Tax=Thalassotalea sp. ND16A TaxID=1535422 RepID=UPI00051A695E|nr:UTRA domain-containing protein [Thalassotalea sp. ND16A]KGK00143.1 putative transcriptional regulator, GntR family [Thalassotalea sp. ND16A]
MTQPKYKVIAEAILTKIQTGEWLEGDKIPSEMELAELFSASRMTARKAVDSLVHAEYLERLPSVGTFIKAPKAQSSLLEIKNISDEIIARGHDHKMVVLSKMTLVPNDKVAFELSAFESKVFKIVILHYENDTPIQLEERFVNAELVPQFLEQDFTKITANQYLTLVAPLSEAHVTVEAIEPSNILKHHLHISSGTPCLKIIRSTFSDGKAISYAMLYHPADKYKLTSLVKL